MSENSAGQLPRPATVGDAPSTAHDRAPEPGPEVLSDSDLLQRCRVGDADAWAIVVDRYERLVFSVALRNGVTREDAGDVTQTTFIALLDAIDTLREDERLGSWLMTVARRQAWRIRRRQAVVTSTFERPDASADAIEDWERVEWLHAGLQQLGSPCQKLLTALYLDHDSPSYAVIAPRLDRAVGSIGPLRARCLARLRAILEEST